VNIKNNGECGFVGLKDKDNIFIPPLMRNLRLPLTNWPRMLGDSFLIEFRPDAWFLWQYRAAVLNLRSIGCKVIMPRSAVEIVFLKINRDDHLVAPIVF